MSSPYPELTLVRHGETEWSATGKHTGRSDIPLTAIGTEAARRVADRLQGLSTRQILADRPGWQLFRDGCPKGEAAADVGARADRIIREFREAGGSVLAFSSSHFLRVLAARWLGLPPEGGANFVLDTASVSVLGYEHDLTEPVIRHWNLK
jgi:broad specificity phosphatase PhoE